MSRCILGIEMNARYCVPLISVPFIGLGYPALLGQGAQTKSSSSMKRYLLKFVRGFSSFHAISATREGLYTPSAFESIYATWVDAFDSVNSMWVG